MSKTFKDSPQPLRELDPNPLFRIGSDTYTVVPQSPMERQRSLDGSLHSMNRATSISPGFEDSKPIIQKSNPSPSKPPLDPAAVIKAFMDKDKDEDDLEKKKPKLGSGERFKQLSSKLSKKGVKDPDALAATIGRKKLGKNRFQKLAAKGK